MPEAQTRNNRSYRTSSNKSSAVLIKMSKRKVSPWNSITALDNGDCTPQQISKKIRGDWLDEADTTGVL
jgi:hypothetical protein